MSTETQMEQISDNVAISGCSTVAVLNHGFAVKLNAMSDGKKSGAAPKKILIREPKDGKISAKGGGEIASWGASNLWPQERIELIKKDTELAPLFKKKAAFMMGVGVIPCVISGYRLEGKTIIPTFTPADPTAFKEQYAFTNNRKFNRWLREAAIDYCYFGNIFPEIILAADRKKVKRIAHKEATDCRLQVMSEKKKEIEWCHINANWENYKDEDTISLRVIDSTRTSDVLQIQNDKGRFHYIYVSSYPSPGDGYYQTPAHEGYFLSGWYDVGIAIPEFKKYLMKNQMAIKYHIEIDTAYWPARYKDWDKLSESKKKDHIRAEMTAFNNELTGAENSGAAFTTAMEFIKHTGEHRHFWKITPIKNTNVDGEHIEDSREASMHKYRAVGFDPAVLGLGPGRENAGGGSGSDKWAAIKILLAELWPDRQVLLDPVFFAYEYNGWDELGIIPMVVDHPVFATNTASEKPSEAAKTPTDGKEV